MAPSRTKLQIFVSSTFADLQDERRAAVEAILQAGHIPAGMELFAAEGRPQWDIIQQWIQESDVFMLIVGGRYGSIEPTSGKSYTELEYRYATDLKKPLFSVVLSDEWIESKLRTGGSTYIEKENPLALRDFRAFVKTAMVRIVISTVEIQNAVYQSVLRLQQHNRLQGWIRTEEAQVPASVLAELARLSDENQRLRAEISAAEKTIEGHSVREWSRILADHNIPEYQENKIRDLFWALIEYGKILAVGVSNASSSHGLEIFLFQNVASGLVALGLAVHDKVPAGVHWQRVRLSSAGILLHRALRGKIAEIRFRDKEQAPQEQGESAPIQQTEKSEPGKGKKTTKRTSTRKKRGTS